MTYLKKHNEYFGLRRSQPSRRAAFVVLGVVVIVIGLRLLFPHLYSAIFTSIAVPFWRTKFSLESGSLRSPAGLLAENQQLRLLIDDYEGRLASVAAVQQENQDIKRLLVNGSLADLATSSVNSTSSTTIALDLFESNIRRQGFILAPVISRPPFSVFDEIIIDGGRDRGFASGDLVYAAAQVLIGRISEVFEQTSKVILYSSPGESYEVLIGPQSAAAVGIGRGGGQYYAELPSSVSISPGDFVIAPSLFDKPFGVVSAVLRDPVRPFETVLFSPLVNVYELRWVMVKHRVSVGNI